MNEEAKKRVSLDGRVAIVTGGHSGIGRGIVQSLYDFGANVVIAGRREELGGKVSAEYGDRAMYVKTDITVLDDIQNMVDKTVERFGRIDILVNCSGTVVHKAAEDVSYDDWRKVMDVNLDGLFFVSQRVGRVMIEQKSGSIINISSNSDNLVMTPQKQAGYNASKAGVDMVTKCLAYEWAEHNIRVNAIAPGYVQTDILPDDVTPDGRKYKDIWLDMIPTGRFGQPGEIGDLVVYLASDMSGFMTGSVVLIDGGYSLT